MTCSNCAFADKSGQVLVAMVLVLYFFTGRFHYESTRFCC
jgi:hypothetical protein